MSLATDLNAYCQYFLGLDETVCRYWGRSSGRGQDVRCQEVRSLRAIKSAHISLSMLILRALSSMLIVNLGKVVDSFSERSLLILIVRSKGATQKTPLS